MNQMLMRKVYLFAIGKINSQTEKTYLIWNRKNNENKMSLKSQRKTKTNNSISTKTTLNYHCYYYKNKKKLEEKKKIVISTLLTTTSLSFNVISYSLLLSALCFCIISTEKTNYIPYCLSINIILLKMCLHSCPNKLQADLLIEVLNLHRFFREVCWFLGLDLGAFNCMTLTGWYWRVLTYFEMLWRLRFT